MYIGIATRIGALLRRLNLGPTPTFRRLRGSVTNTSSLNADLTHGIILTAGRSPQGYVGYSSFEDDAFGDVTFPAAVLVPEKPLLALMSLPGGGDYIVFDADARDDLSGKKIILGEHEAIMAEADLISYNDTELRTQIIYLDDQFVIEEGEQYIVDVQVYEGIPQELEGDLVQLQDADGTLHISHNLAASLVQVNETRGHLYPPVTLFSNMVQESEFEGTMRVQNRLAADLIQTSPLNADLTQNNFRRLSGSVIQAATYTGDLDQKTFQRIQGDVVQTSSLLASLSTEVTVDSDAQVIINQMTVTPSTTRQSTINNLVVALKNAGVWNKLRLMYMLAAHDDQAARIDWKNPLSSGATKVGVTTFNPDVGFTPGTDGALDSGYALTGMNNASIGMTFKTDKSGPPDAVSAIGMEVTGTYLRWLVNPGNPANQQFVASVMTDVGLFAATGSSDFSRIFTLDRTGLDVGVYASGALIESASQAINQGTIPASRTFHTLASIQDAASARQFTDRNQQLLILHDHLTSAEITAMHSALDAYIADMAPAFDADAQAIMDRMTTQPDGAKKTKINNLVVSLKGHSLWSKFLTLHLFDANAEQSALIDWKNPTGPLATNSGCTFTANDSFTRTANANKILVPFTPSPPFAVNDASIGVYVKEGVAGDNRYLSTNRVAGGFLTLTLLSSPSMQSALNDTVADTFARTGGDGLYVASRNGVNSKRLQKNNTVLGTATTESSLSPPDCTLMHVFDGALGSGGSVRAAFTGGALTQSDVNNLNTDLLAYLT